MNTYKILIILAVISFYMISVPSFGSSERCKEQFCSMAKGFKKISSYYFREWDKWSNLQGDEYDNNGVTDEYYRLGKLTSEALKKANYFLNLWSSAVNGHINISCSEFYELLEEYPQLRESISTQSRDNRAREAYEMRKKTASEQLSKDINKVIGYIDKSRKKQTRDNKKNGETPQKPDLDEYVPEKKEYKGLDENEKDYSKWEDDESLWPGNADKEKEGSASKGVEVQSIRSELGQTGEDRDTGVSGNEKAIDYRNGDAESVLENSQHRSSPSSAIQDIDTSVKSNFENAKYLDADGLEYDNEMLDKFGKTYGNKNTGNKILNGLAYKNEIEKSADKGLGILGIFGKIGLPVFVPIGAFIRGYKKAVFGTFERVISIYSNTIEGKETDMRGMSDAVGSCVSEFVRVTKVLPKTDQKTKPRK